MFISVQGIQANDFVKPVTKTIDLGGAPFLVAALLLANLLCLQDLMKNFIRYLLTVGFKLLCWFLITGSLQTANLILLILCVILPAGSYKNLKIKALLPEIINSLSLPFLMIKESFELMMIQNPQDVFVEEEASHHARQGSVFAGFLDLFRITFTPMSLVTRRLSRSQWRVHLVKEADSLDNQKGMSS